jgi:membrane protein implicated in regulation of membrane protease activity
VSVAASPLALRWLTVLAAGFLAFDGAALLGLGLWSGRTRLLAAGMVLFLSSGIALLVWRRHLRRLNEIGEARRELRDEAEELRRLLKS